MIKPYLLTNGNLSPAPSKLHDCKDVRGFLSQCCSAQTWATELHSSYEQRPLWDLSHDIRIADGDLSSALTSTTFTPIFARSSLQRALTCSGCGPNKEQSPSASSVAGSCLSQLDRFSRTHPTSRKMSQQEEATMHQSQHASLQDAFKPGSLCVPRPFSSSKL